MNCCSRVTFWVFRNAVGLYNWFFRQKYEKVHGHVSAATLPWLFVGVELTDGKLLDRTHHAQYLIDSNIVVNPKTICMSIEPQTIKRCFYLDAKTLKEEEIPAEGITINDS